MEDAGGHPWPVEGGTLSTMFLFNHSPDSQEVNVRVADDKVLWLKVYKLKSMETRAITINDLISSQEKDASGKVLHKNLVKGEASWLSPATTEVSGRILQSDRSQPLARNFSCGVCAFLCGSPYLFPSYALALGISDQGSLGSINVNWCNMGCSPYSGCPPVNTPTAYGSGGLTHGWSGGGSVASIVSGWGSALTTWQGTGAGHATAVYSASMGGYITCQASAPVSVELSCFEQLKYRPAVAFLGITLGNHSFWWDQVDSPTNSSLNQYILDAGPSLPATCPNLCGDLIDWVNSGTTGHYNADTSSQTSAWQSVTTDAVCSQADALYNAAATWPQSRYNYAVGTSPNSNTFAHMIATSAGISPTAPPNAPGW